jgi:hypothetical protein
MHLHLHESTPVFGYCVLSLASTHGGKVKRSYKPEKRNKGFYSTLNTLKIASVTLKT